MHEIICRMDKRTIAEFMSEKYQFEAQWQLYLFTEEKKRTCVGRNFLL